MKKKIMNSAETIIRKNYPSYDDEKMEIIMYGLEGIYLSITKLVIITLVSYLLGIFKEYVVVLLLFNVLRLTAFGLHANNSNACLFTSMSAFIITPYLCSFLVLNMYVKLGLGIFCVICFILYAPADTEKRPIVNPKRRLVYKIVTTLTGICFVIGALVLKENFICNALIFSMLIEVFLIHPLTYKVFNMSYDNYKNFKV